MLGALLAIGAVLFVEGYIVQSAGRLVIGALLLGGAVLVFFVKVGEEIQPVTAKWEITGEIGEVVREVGNRSKGIVRVRSELWSALSETPLPPGTKVRVTRTDGLLAWVEKAEGADTTTVRSTSG